MLRTHGTLLGRSLIGLLFLLTGVGMLTNPNYGIDGVAGMIEMKGLPLAMLLAWVVVVVKILGGAALILGYRVGCAASALIVFTALTIVFFHLGEGESTNMLKNLALIGGLLYVLAYGPGGGWRLNKPNPPAVVESEE